MRAPFSLAALALAVAPALSGCGSDCDSGPKESPHFVVTVTDAADGRALCDATVGYFEAGTVSTRWTLADGSSCWFAVEFGGKPEGKVTLGASADGYDVNTVEADLRYVEGRCGNAEPLDVKISLTRTAP